MAASSTDRVRTAALADASQPPRLAYERSGRALRAVPSSASGNRLSQLSLNNGRA